MVASVFAVRECYFFINGNIFGSVPLFFDLAISLASFFHVYASSCNLALFSLANVSAPFKF